MCHRIPALLLCVLSFSVIGCERKPQAKPEQPPTPAVERVAPSPAPTPVATPKPTPEPAPLIALPGSPELTAEVLAPLSHISRHLYPTSSRGIPIIEIEAVTVSQKMRFDLADMATISITVEGAKGVVEYYDNLPSVRKNCSCAICAQRRVTGGRE